MADLLKWQEAVDTGVVSEGKYIEVTYPDESETFWRIERIGEDLVLLGKPTDGLLTLRGKQGYEECFELADKLAQKEYALPDIFNSVRACGSRKTLENLSIDESQEALNELSKIYCRCSEDLNLERYFLTLRRVSGDADHAFLCVHCVNYGSLQQINLRLSDGLEYGKSCAVRPEAVPNPDCYVQIDGCDGSWGNPYILLSNATIQR